MNNDYVEVSLKEALEMADRELLQAWISLMEDFFEVNPNVVKEKVTFKMILRQVPHLAKNFSHGAIEESKFHFQLAKILYLEGIRDAYDEEQITKKLY